ncbi:MAG TPA: hypothetical protein VIH90_00795 [Candidatus Saccharimonadales bacterium]
MPDLEYVPLFIGDNENVRVNPRGIEGFRMGILSPNIVSVVLTDTFSEATSHGASALGLDLDSMMGRMHSEGHIDAALGLGSKILEDVAPRVDGASWSGWIREQFPNYLASRYGVGSEPHKIASERDKATGA